MSQILKTKEPPITVLLIDDQAIIGEAVRRICASQPDIQFHFVSDPTQAIAKARELQPTVILQDLVMPGVDGLDLVSQFRAETATATTPLVVLSSKEEGQTKAEAFARGANDYMVKLPDPLEIIARLRYHSRGYIAQLQRNAAYEALASELHQAAEYVRSLLPAPMDVPALRTRWVFTPSASLGGDCFGYRMLDDSHFAFWLIDVCGHGVGPSLLSVSVRNLLQGAAPSVDLRQPGAVMTMLNASFQMATQNNLYFTGWYGVLHVPTRALRWSGAAHPSVLIAGPSGIRECESQNTIIGMVDGIAFEETLIDLDHGDRIYIYSDGVVEIAIPDGTVWSHSQFMDFMRTDALNAPSPIDRVMQYTEQLQGGAAYQDDVSMVEIEVR
ncbi:MAG: response regulator [Planctomycetes bacterium]|nr:response regulator [Planctomycetota bacterium]